MLVSFSLSSKSGVQWRSDWLYCQFACCTLCEWPIVINKTFLCVFKRPYSPFYLYPMCTRSHACLLVSYSSGTMMLSFWFLFSILYFFRRLLLLISSSRQRQRPRWRRQRKNRRKKNNTHTQKLFFSLSLQDISFSGASRYISIDEP